nr:nucleotide exchange factor GrpE [Glycomyces salinus]
MSDEDKRKDEEAEGAESKSESAEGDDAADSGDELTVEDILAEASDDGQAADDTITVLQTTLEERTRDLQRLHAEFQNYRKRVERDKARAGEQATGAILSALLPILDDLDRAREHGDLNGPFGSVAEQLTGALTKQGLEPFGEKGDQFDPQIHEAVAHMQMGDVDGPTCIDVMRRGYRLGDRLLRPALVAVAEPLEEPDAPEPAEAGQQEAEPPVEPEPEGAAESSEAGAEAAGTEVADRPGEEDADDSVGSDGSAESDDSEGGKDSKGDKDS